MDKEYQTEVKCPTCGKLLHTFPYQLVPSREATNEVEALLAAHAVESLACATSKQWSLGALCEVYEVEEIKVRSAVPFARSKYGGPL